MITNYRTFEKLLTLGLSFYICQISMLNMFGSNDSVESRAAMRSWIRADMEN